MKTTVDYDMFRDAFLRSERANHFSDAGIIALWNYLEEFEEDIGEEVELDVVAICSAWCEYPTALDGYRDMYTGQGDVKTEEDALRFFKEKTDVIRFDGGIIYNKDF